MEVDREGDEPKPTSEQKEGEKEGRFLLGSPKFAKLGNGRLRCVETGHELPAKERESYSQSKGCRLALIDFALSRSKPPLNMFKPDPITKSKIVCKLTGDTINKTEEHIWKHINGRRFLNKLEQMEVEKMEPTDAAAAAAAAAEEDKKQEEDTEAKEDEKKKKKDKKKKKKDKERRKKKKEADKKQRAEENGSLEGEAVEGGSDAEELDFWVPPVGSRWDFDDGKDRWESGSSSDDEADEDAELGVDEKDDEIETVELSMRTKRMAIAVGPSSFATRKKKMKTTL